LGNNGEKARPGKEGFLLPKRRKFRYILLVSLLVVLVFSGCGLVQANGYPLPAFGNLWKDFFENKVFSESSRSVQLGLGYVKGRGFFLQVFQETPVKIVVDGTTLYTRAFLPSVEDLLEESGVELGEKDRAEAKIVTGEGEIPEIRVIRVCTRILTEKETIPVPVHRIYDQSLPSGKAEVRAQGRPGVLLKKFRVVTENGKEIRREKLGEEVIQEPEPRIIAVGQGSQVALQPAASSRFDGRKVRQVMTMVATAYTYTGNPTASGVWPYVGGVAVDPEVIPLGSRLYIEGYGPAVAVDTGGLIKGNRVDVFFKTAEECFQWGKRKVKVYILE